MREVAMSGQLALLLVEERLVPTAVWETVPPEVRAKVTIMLARLLAAAIEVARDE
ncbi:MAG: hypothetical protein JO181_12810 [Solirubrobacterales bacterium]|nr:hypothetical protein [Solirubrobacterales bacterium]